MPSLWTALIFHGGGLFTIYLYGGYYAEIEKNRLEKGDYEIVILLENKIGEKHINTKTFVNIL